MRIKLKTQMVGPQSHAVGDIVDFPTEQAERLIKRNLAEAVEVEAPIAPVSQAPKKSRKKVVRKNALNTD